MTLYSKRAEMAGPIIETNFLSDSNEEAENFGSVIL